MQHITIKNEHGGNDTHIYVYPEQINFATHADDWGNDDRPMYGEIITDIQFDETCLEHGVNFPEGTGLLRLARGFDSPCDIILSFTHVVREEGSDYDFEYVQFDHFDDKRHFVTVYNMGDGYWYAEELGCSRETNEGQLSPFFVAAKMVANLL